MQNKFPKLKIFIAILFIFILALVFAYFYQAENNNNIQARDKEKQWQTETLRRNEIRELDNSFKAVADEKTALETHFAESSDVVPFLDTIEALAPAVDAKAEVTSVEILDDHSGLLIGLKTSGSWGSMYKLLTLLENSPYELEFVSMDMQKEPGAPLWDANYKIKLLTFIQ